MANFNVTIQEGFYSPRFNANFLVPSENPYAVSGKITLLNYDPNTGIVANKTIDLYALDISVYGSFGILPIQGQWKTGSRSYDFLPQAPNFLTDFPEAVILRQTYLYNLTVKHSSTTEFIGIITSIDTDVISPEGRIIMNYAYIPIGTANSSMEISGYVRIYFYDGSLIEVQP